MANYRVYVEKKQGFQTESNSLLNNISDSLHMNLNELRVINVYDVFNVTSSEIDVIKQNVLAEVVTDKIYNNLNLEDYRYITVEYLPGQYDQRADSAQQCIKLVINNQDVVVNSGKIFLLNNHISDIQLAKIKKYLINPIEMREKDLNSLSLSTDISVKEIETYHMFIEFSLNQLKQFLIEKNLAMTIEDLIFIQDYFKNEEKRNPTETELLVLDTYWSDHCRHTTFETIIEDIQFPDGKYKEILLKSFNSYLESRQLVHKLDKPITLMDMATIKAKELQLLGKCDDIDLSDEVNACSIYINVDVNGSNEKWLLMFKNETHNHPTEIEPFGGASTCIGGAIRDPLSGRAYVYQAMRVTGAANILEPIENTLEGKIPQKKISYDAALGYSSYGNQIGLATSHVREIYHDGYIAKRMEVGAVVGAVKAENIKREKPVEEDVIILLGGKTGRDGIGGATGSSKIHNEYSIETASSEVQKGNAPTERKIQRLFRNPEVSKMIKKCNDFGAGGVAVAIGELADSLEINLDCIPTKYSGLNATEKAISESQERMAVVVSRKDANKFCLLAENENLEATVVAKVTNNNRLLMKSKGIDVVDISREFLNTNGKQQQTKVEINNISDCDPFINTIQGKNLKTKFLNNLKQKNIASQKGLVEMFDSTIGATTVLMPYGGKYQLTEVDASVQKIPVLDGETNTCSIMTYGFNPTISNWSPFHGAIYAVVESISKVVAVGGNYQGIRFSFQEYFRKLGINPKNWGLPFTALLGAIYAQSEFELPAIGGKDSMSGSFKDKHVPPTLISFAVNVENVENIISPEFKQVNNYVYLIKHNELSNLMPNIKQLKDIFDFIYNNVKQKHIMSAFALKQGGLAEAIAKMSFGNKIGIEVNDEKIINDLFTINYGSILIETNREVKYEHALFIGRTIKDSIILFNKNIMIDEAIKAWSETFNSIYPTQILNEKINFKPKTYNNKIIKTPGFKASPKVFIPVFPGTNCEYDSEKAFLEAGAKTKLFVFKNRHQKDINESINQMVNHIESSQILMFSGGFSAGDEPDGSGKFITTVLMNERIKESIYKFLERDGLILGICNGFQALIKSGLLPYETLGNVLENYPTLVKNDLNRHVSKIINSKIISNKSPWFMGNKVNEIHKIAVSHGEGKFVAPNEVIENLFMNGQIATQYVDNDGNPTMNSDFNPNGSLYAVEGVTSLDGKILGKMGHSERKGNYIFKNITGNKNQDIFKNGVNYFKL